MPQWSKLLSGRFIHRTICFSVGVALLVTPITASAASSSNGKYQNVQFAAEQSGKANFQGSLLTVGENRFLTRSNIEKEWDGIDPDYKPDQAVKAVKELLSLEDYEALFPNRLGSPAWYEIAKGKEYFKADQKDYFSYSNLIDAVTEVANIKLKISHRKGSPGVQEINRLDKDARIETLVSRSSDFNSAKNKKQEIVTVIIDFGTFLKEGFKKDRKRELAAFLANLAHETGGGWSTAPGGELKWGLFWNENIAGRTGVNTSAFVDEASAALYPGVKDKRYYGRGPIMLSWNFNYGLFSSIIYGDKNVLLKNPEIVSADGKVGFMTAILFWMTPQDPKPSAHDVIINKWKPSKADIAKGLSQPGFGITIMVLNGLEANLGEVEGSSVKRRAGHYRDITKTMGVDITGEKVDTLGMKPF
ncbi:chitinase [Paenibacillus sp. GSMTC-2017]|uniref:chitinase n=1 Tax=Paenibacillus sp. GSMTC-2017 TaxID=2794350 RepID=UPI0018D67FA9|nr:chitinase [Paenibacillus sp. GSMTC-2017]MBH5317255.1 chitinase [Paenibacillus sp. GSMTC-2017]